MPQIGSSAKPTASQEWFGLNSDNHFAELFTMPEAGTITEVGFWAAGKDAGVSARACVWGAGGSLASQSGLLTLAGRSFGLGQSDEYRVGVPGVALGAGIQFYVGLARNPNGQVQLGYNAGSSHKHKTSASWPTSLAGASDHGGDAGFYAIYEVAPPPSSGEGVYVRRGGVWVEAEGPYVRRGGVWVAADVKVRRGGAWVDPT